MKLDGVKEVQTDIKKNEVTVTYDDAKINYAKIAEVLTKNYLPPKGEPKYLRSPRISKVQGTGRRGPVHSALCRVRTP